MLGYKSIVTNAPTDRPRARARARSAAHRQMNAHSGDAMMPCVCYLFIPRWN